MRHRLPFVAQPVGSASGALEAAQAAAQHWSVPSPQLMRIGMNGIYRAGPNVVLRVGRPTVRAAASINLAEMLGHAGIRAPQVVRPEPFVHGDLSVWALEHIDSLGDVDWCAVGAMVARVHRLDADVVAAMYPLPLMADLPLWRFEELVADVDDLLDPAARRGLRATIDRCDHRSEWPSATVCHGDVHPGNVLQAADGPVLLDWDLMCRGTPAWDHAPLLRLHERWGGRKGLYEAFAAGYGASLRFDSTAEAVAELRLAAATLMRLRASRHDPAAWPEAELRLRYWRGDGDAPDWTAQ